MPTATPLIATIVGGLTLAFILGAIAHRLKISPLVGYLLAGVVAGPWTPGFVADPKLAGELAEIGIILLMFGVGLHFSLKDLLSVKAVAIPGAVGQIALTSSIGTGLGLLLGWPLAGSIVFGLSLSVASTVVLLRTLAERGVLESDRGRTMVGWLVVEDLVMVLALVLLPALVGGAKSSGGIGWLGERIGLADGVGAVVLITLMKVGGFIVLMLVVGRRVVPWILHWVAHTGSRELFRLSVLVLALGVAYAASASFGVSFALGAFLAGMLLSESQLASRAAQETLPLRDAFAVLFFVSVGMLFDPAVLLRSPFAVLGTVAVILCVKALAGFLLMRTFGQPRMTSVLTAISIAQIGEFSFILSGLGVFLQVLPQEGRDLVLAGSIISILLNPVMFMVVDYLRHRRERAEEALAPTPIPTPVEDEAAEPEPVALTDHAVLVGYGHVGATLAAQLHAQNMPLVVLEDREDLVENLHAQGIPAIHGNGAAPMLVRAANVAQARILFIAIPQAFEAGQIIQQARAANPALRIIARTYDDAETEYFTRMGADKVVNAEEAAAHIMLEGEACRPPVPEATPEMPVAMPASLFLTPGPSAA